MAEVRQPLGKGVRRVVTAVVVLAVIAGFVGFLYQRPVTQWGSTAAERDGAVAGDDIVTEADVQWTRAITIDAPPEAVWPWLIQIGADKAGFYNYDWGEQIAGFDPVHNATTIHAEWQTLRVGDAVHPTPNSDWTVVELEANRVLVLNNPVVTPTDWTWATELRPLDGDRTRVVTRIRSHKGTLFSYALDVPDLILFPRLLTGLKQRAEGTLPGMPGTHTGQPFPLARVPVHGAAAVAWLAGLALAAFGLAPLVGFGWWGRRRMHPWITVCAAFVAASGYLIMSDTPPLHFFRNVWVLGLVAGTAVGLVLARRQPLRPPADSAEGGRWFPRAAVAFVETGIFIVLPVTTVWQAATGSGWTASAIGRICVSAVAAAIAAGVGGVAWRRMSGSARHGFVTAASFAVAYAATGSAMAALLGAVIYESGRRPVPEVPVFDLDLDIDRSRESVGAR